MKEHDRVTGAYLDIGHALPQDVHTLLGIGKLCTYHDTTLPFFLLYSSASIGFVGDVKHVASAPMAGLTEFVSLSNLM